VLQAGHSLGGVVLQCLIANNAEVNAGILLSLRALTIGYIFGKCQIFPSSQVAFAIEDASHQQVASTTFHCLHVKPILLVGMPQLQ